MGEGIVMLFHGNHATRYGGAIKVLSSALVTNASDFFTQYRSCFIRYSDTIFLKESEWNVSS